MKCQLPWEVNKRLTQNDEFLRDLPSDITEFVRFEQTLNPKSGDSQTATYDIARPLANAEELFRRVTNGEVKTVDEYKAAPLAVKEQVALALRARMQMVARLGADWTNEMENIHLSDYAAEMFKAEIRRSKGSTRMFDFIKWPFRVLGETHRAIQEFGPARDLYASAKELQSYVGRQRKIILDRVTEALDLFENETGISSDIVDKYLGWFDGQYWDDSTREQLRMEFNDDAKTRRQIEGVLNARNIEVHGDAVFDTFVGYMKQFQAKHWNRINYGVENPDDKYKAEEHSDSIAGFITTAGGMLRKILEMRDGLAKAKGEELTPAERNYLEKFDPSANDKFHPRWDNYVPTRRRHDEDMFTQYLDVETNGFMAPLSRFLERRGAIFDTSQRVTELLKENILSFGFAMETVSSYAMAKGTRDALDIVPSFSETRPELHTALKWWSDALISGHERDISAQKKESMKATRNTLTALHSIGALILANPASSINNYIGGMLGLYGEFGYNIFKWNKSFKTARSENSIEGVAAREVESYIEQFMQTPGRYSDYASASGGVEAPGGALTKITEQAKNASMKIADYATRQGIVPVIQNISQLTMQKSEQNLRNFAKPVMFDMVRQQLQAIDASKLSETEQRDLVRGIINSVKTDAFYKMNNALLDPSKENKPFWSWMAASTATNPAMAVIGSAASMFYMFRQVAAHNLRLMSSVTMRAFDDMNHPGLKGVERYSGAGALMFITTALLMSIYDIFAGRSLSGLPRISAGVSGNPLQETKVAGMGALAGLGAVLNFDMPQDMAEDIGRDFARFAGGVLAGSAAEHIAKEYQGQTDRPLGSLFNVFDTVKGSFDLVTNIPYAILGKDPAGAVARTSGDFYQMKRDIAERTETAYPWLSYQNDYITLIKNFEQAMIPVEEGSYAERARADFRTRAIMSLFGLTPSYLPEAYEGAYGRSNTFEFDVANTERYVRNSGMTGRQFYNTVGDRILRQASQYGKVYPQSLL